METHDKKMHNALLSLGGRLLPDGGFSEFPTALYRVDATAWAVIAMVSAASADRGAIAAARRRLATSQLKDGRVTLVHEYPTIVWPTALAVLAWQDSSEQRNSKALALGFLLNTAGEHWKSSADSPVADDPSIRGWPWTEKTSPWVEPTALALMALRASRHDTHPRAQEAARMLVNRQLPHGGWNYGSTVVYGQELYPQPSTTGIALTALAGQVERAEINKSLVYLAKQPEQCRSPFSLSWTLMGLSAWGERPVSSHAWIIESLSLQEKYGMYATSLLSLLITSFFVDGDISKYLQKERPWK